jgi:DNA-binding HxlR family transcriptional regulator
LLIVRELLTGPKRYTDLRDGLPGLATDLLATRLRELQQNGVIVQRDVPPPTPARVYELTERGYALKPAIIELARWGRPLLREAADDWLPNSALSLGFAATFQPDAAVGLDEIYDVEVDGQRASVHVHDGTVEVTPGGTDKRAAVRIVTDRPGFTGLATGHPGKRAHINGDTDALARFQRIFSPATK